MSRRKRIKYVHEGRYVAQVEVNLIEDDTEWSPYLSLEDAEKLDDVRAALARGTWPQPQSWRASSPFSP